MHKRKILFAVIFIYIIIILFLLYRLRTNKDKVLDKMVVNYISEKQFVSSPSGNLKYFYEPRPNLVFREKPPWLASEVIYTINSDTLNERYEYTFEKPKNTFRIITLGDSFTWGLYVNTSENFSEKLEDLLNQKIQCGNINKFEVINLGMTGYDITYAVERFKRRGLKYHPDLVIFLMKTNNFYVNGDLIYQKLDEYGLAKDRTNIKKLWNKIYEEITKDEIKSKTVKNQKQQLEQMIDYTKNKIIFYFIYVTLQKEQEELKKELKAIYENHKNVTFFESKLDLIRSTSFIQDPDQKGHEEMAQELGKYLIDAKIINCKL